MLFETLFYKSIFSKNWETPQILISYLEEKGFVRLGAGWYSVAYALPNSSFVIKINSGDFDYGFAYYLNMCINNKTNPHLLDVFAYKEYTLDNPFYFTLLPRLNRLPTSDHENADITILRTMCNMLQNGIEPYSKIIEHFSYVDSTILDMFKILSIIDTSVYKFDICEANILQDHKRKWILSDPIHKIKK